MLISSDDTRRKGFQRAGHMRRGKKELRPLRMIVGYNAGKEVLECGHEQWPRQDIAGDTNATRRRCRHCPKIVRDAPTGGEARMARSRDWNAGFKDGYLACLFAFTGHHAGDDVAFVEAVRAFGGTSALLERARHNDDIVLPELRKAVRAINRHKLSVFRNGSSDSASPNTEHR